MKTQYSIAVQAGLILTLLLIIDSASAQSVEEARATRGLAKADVLREFGGKDNTPDHLMFAFLVHHVSSSYDKDPVVGRSIVIDNMRTGPVEAEVFVQEMLATRKEIRDLSFTAKQKNLCKGASSRSRSESYEALVDMDDRNFRIRESTYKKILRGLNSTEQEDLLRWINESKQGYRHYQLNHATLYEKRGIDVATHIEAICERVAERQARVSQ